MTDPQTISLTRPDDWHLHLRSGKILQAVIGHTAACFGRALVMPNLKPPVTTVELATAYREEILACLPAESKFDPQMTLYLTDNTSLDTVEAAAATTWVKGFKYYPAGATTNSDSGVTSITRVMPILEAMADHDLVLQVHGEVTDAHIDIFDREEMFIDQVLQPLHREIPELKIVFEHITTKQGADFVSASDHNVAATITPQHLLFSRNDLFVGGIRPHLYCLPVLKRHHHQQALLSAAVSGDKSFFLGTDSAPHLQGLKENSCGCAGVYSAHGAIEFYAEVFESMHAMDKLEAFASFNGADFYGVERNQDRITLTREAWRVPETYPVDNGDAVNPEMAAIVPLGAGENLGWKLTAG